MQDTTVGAWVPVVMIHEQFMGWVPSNTSGILYPWTGLGKMVRTGTYQYIPVQVGTGQYKNSQLVHTSMYEYIP